MNWRDHISVDPGICHGSACIKGTRVMVSVILDNLGANEEPSSIATAYRVTEDDIRAAILYAAESEPLKDRLWIVEENDVRICGEN